MNGKNLMGFQAEAVRDGAAPLLKCLQNIRLAREFSAPEEQLNLVRQHQGALLVNAPTGIGKTLIAGGVVERLCASEKMVWLWFAPFTGIVEQTIGVIGREFSELQPLRPGIDRGLENLRRGNVYVSTWSGVATRKREGRRIRQDGEIPSIDRLLDAARAKGHEIGLVIDEAHHSFRENAEAHKFCRDVLSPAVSVMLTATPREGEMKRLAESLGAEKFSRVEISRQTGIDELLLKRGVRVALFRASSPARAHLVDFKRLALSEALKAHLEIKELLTRSGVEVSPLLMVQADEERDGAQKAKEMLTGLGMPEEAVRVHTADEPDPEFMRIAEDESVEVLVFKMAAATGFDAPRAFVLASLRRSRDPDFGTQIIGRILRKHRNHRVAENPPEPLEYGYVFLSDHENQSGLVDAARRIKALRDEVSATTDDVNIVVVGDKPEVQSTPGGVGQVLSQWTKPPRDESCEHSGEGEDLEETPVSETAGRKESQLLIAGGLPIFPPSPPITYGPRREFLYPLRSDLTDAPTQLSTVAFNIGKVDTFTESVAALFPVDNDMLALVNKKTEEVVKETVEIFQGDFSLPEKIPARIARDELRREAQMKFGFVIDKDGWLDEDEFRKLLANRLRIGAAGQGWETDDDFIEAGIDKIMALRPDVIQRAISHVVAVSSDAKNAAPLPKELCASEDARRSRLNIYGVHPPGMNSWERKFAETLDLDTSETALWWHRNPVHAKHSVRIPLPGFGGYFPDFVVGVAGRSNRDGILLVETKRDINDYEGNAAAKAQAIHPRYGRVMMLWLKEKTNEWRIVEHNPATGENQAKSGFGLEMMRAY